MVNLLDMHAIKSLSHLLYMDKRQIIISRNVVFDEHPKQIQTIISNEGEDNQRDEHDNPSEKSEI